MKYKIVNQVLNMGGQVEYLVELDSEEAVLLTYPTAQTEDILDAKMDEISARKSQEKANQEKIDKAIAEALWTDEERENLG
tara:strand:+ start:342 stop:584 length:243 start_codon:yes stop_codon:yes gene_type:complete